MSMLGTLFERYDPNKAFQNKIWSPLTSEKFFRVQQSQMIEFGNNEKGKLNIFKIPDGEEEMEPLTPEQKGEFAWGQYHYFVFTVKNEKPSESGDDTEAGRQSKDRTTQLAIRDAAEYRKNGIDRS